MAFRGEIITSSFNLGLVTASYFASLCGCILTVELLHRRGTGVHTWRSWFETLSCAISLGVIGIWCMHFIGNRAIVLGDGSHKMQLVYSQGYSTLSAFLPVIGLTIAFACAEYPFRSPIFHWIALTCTGIFAGLSVVGMHYIGNLGISNYHITYVPRFLAGSVIIAIGDTLAVLVLFYTWREKWISDWWKRLLCAIALAGGVSAMHFTAATHCIYRLQHYNKAAAIHRRDVQVIIAGVLCIAGGLVMVCLLLVRRYRAQALKRSSQKVMLACAMFDPDGRILVTTDGVLPAREITDKYNGRTFSEEFDTAHPVFQWIFRVTRNWPGVSELLPRMKSHLAACRMDSEDESQPISSASSARYEPETYNDYSIIFRERFCTAAAALASSMHIPVERIGVLYDQIIETGTLNAEERARKRNTMSPYKSYEDVELGLTYSPFGKGQLLFLTRQLSAESTDRLLNAGFKFGSVQQVGRNIAEAMQIPLAALDVHMANLKHYVDNLTTLDKSGTWLSCFAMIPKVNGKGFDVAVKRSDQDQLPDMQILPYEPLPWQTAFLQRMDEKTTASCIAFLEDRDRRDAARAPHEQQFASVVLQAMTALSQELPTSWFQNARFHGKPVYAHYSQPLNSKAPVTVLYSFVICADLHTSTEAWNSIARVPLSFYNLRQQCYAGSPNHAVMARAIHQEFGPILARKTTQTQSREQKVKKISIHVPHTGNKKMSKHDTRRPSTVRSGSEDNTDSASDTYELVDKTRRFSQVNPSAITQASERDNIWGGILVNSETVVQSDSNFDFDTNSPGYGLGISTAVSTAKPEDTFVDELFAFTRVMIPSKVGH